MVPGTDTFTENPSLIPFVIIAVEDCFHYILLLSCFILFLFDLF